MLTMNHSNPGGLQMCRLKHQTASHEPLEQTKLYVDAEEGSSPSAHRGWLRSAQSVISAASVSADLIVIDIRCVTVRLHTETTGPA